jgi:hypothetical protein
VYIHCTDNTEELASWYNKRDGIMFNEIRIPGLQIKMILILLYEPVFYNNPELDFIDHILN